MHSHTGSVENLTTPLQRLCVALGGKSVPAAKDIVFPGGMVMQGDGYRFETADGKRILQDVQDNAQHVLVMLDADLDGPAIGIRRHQGYIEIMDTYSSHYFFATDASAAVWLNVLMQQYQAEHSTCELLGVIKCTASEAPSSPVCAHPPVSDLNQSMLLPFSDDGYRDLMGTMQAHFQDIVKHISKEKALSNILKAFSAYIDCARSTERRELKVILEALLNENEKLDAFLIAKYFESHSIFQTLKAEFKVKTEIHDKLISELLIKLDEKINQDEATKQQKLNSIELARTSIIKYRRQLERLFQEKEAGYASALSVFQKLKLVKEGCDIDVLLELIKRKLSRLDLYASTIDEPQSKIEQDAITVGEFDAVLTIADELDVAGIFDAELSEQYSQKMHRTESTHDEWSVLLSQLTAEDGITNQPSCASRLDKISKRALASQETASLYKTTFDSVVNLQTELMYAQYNMSPDVFSVHQAQSRIAKINDEISRIEATLSQKERLANIGAISQTKPDLSETHRAIIKDIRTLIRRMEYKTYGSMLHIKEKVRHLKALSKAVSENPNKSVKEIVASFSTDEVINTLKTQRRTTFFIRLFNPEKTNSIKLLEKYNPPPVTKKRKRCW